MKLYVTRTGIAHRGITKNKGDVIEEGDNNHIGALQSVGCESYDELRHKPEPEPKKKAAKKAVRQAKENKDSK